MTVKRSAPQPTIKDYASDIITIKGDIDSIKRHMAEGKLERQSQTDTLRDIKSTLVGNNLNGNKGIVFLLNDIDKRVKDLEKSNSDRQQTESNFKWAGGFIIIAFFTLMIWIIQHLPKDV